MSRSIVIKGLLLLLLNSCVTIPALYAQQTYFVDGYHGGIYGHYPRQYTAFINEMLEKHPDWVINLEIEPETWDTVALREPENFLRFKKYLADQSARGRIEYVNPAYGQPYLYNINGESIIRQFSYGIKKLKQHFPGIEFTTYSTEEPCFTSALPQVLSSFGFKYASLKNPNTCWGGYTRAYGGEMIDWVGPDGTSLPTVPRYAVEELARHSTWETTASTNSPQYLDAAFKAGIKHPVGMCLQDAGWKFGPWLKASRKKYPETYTTWRNYITNVVTDRHLPDWKFSQEDVLVSLVWGSQVLQQIAQQVRSAENKIVRAEKLSSLAKIFAGATYPAADFDEGWRQLLLSQHHDCWIVPYNGRKGDTWIDKVRKWTNSTDSLSSAANKTSFLSLNVAPASRSSIATHYVRAFNANADRFNGYITAAIPEALNGGVIVKDHAGRLLPSQMDRANGTIVFKASIPGSGFNTFQLASAQRPAPASSIIRQQANGHFLMETDLYQITIDPAKGGAIISLLAKKVNNHEFVDLKKGAGLNELKGYFFRDSSFFSSAATAAKVEVLNNGPLAGTIKINGTINKHPFTQIISLHQSEPLIDVKLKIDWQGDPGIGDEYKQNGGYKGEDYHKAFYNDRKKLQTLLPVKITGEKIFKDAPFDVTESKLENSFFETWDSIKNNVLLNWIDLADKKADYGFALFSDHTTNYAHAPGEALGLITQYSGVGLWGRNYSLNGPTEIRYAFYPHKGNWDQAKVWQKNVEWNNQPEVDTFHFIAKATVTEKHIFSIDQQGFEVTAMEYKGNDLLVRLFNPAPAARTATLNFAGNASGIYSVQLDGRVNSQLKVKKLNTGDKVTVSLKKFGLCTLILKNFKAAQ